MKSRFLIESNSSLSKSVRLALSTAYMLNRKFFGFDLHSIRIRICHSASEWKKFSSYYYFEFARGVVLRDGEVVLKSPILAKLSLKAWEKIAAHEINHAYWVHMRPKGHDLWSPIWLVEGLACSVARNDVLVPLKQLGRLLDNSEHRAHLPFRYRTTLFEGPEDVKFLYSLWCHFFDWLICRTGKNASQVIRILAGSKSKADFEIKFEKLLKNTSRKLLREFLETLK